VERPLRCARRRTLSLVRASHVLGALAGALVDANH
jgi:hypothetical protein